MRWNIRNTVNTLPHDRSRLLVNEGLPTKKFSESIDRWIKTMLEDDVSENGYSSNTVSANIISKEEGIISGQIVIDRLLAEYTEDLTHDWIIKEGEQARINDVILNIQGNASDILKIERVMLNLLGKLSGISTITANWVSVTDNIRLACTRKTDWGMLDKWAVHVGGGLTHRLNRSDALMLKENDFASIRRIGESQNIAIEELISNINLEKHSKFTIMEVQDIDEAVLAANTWSKIQKQKSTNDRVTLLLDNMGPEIALEVGKELKIRDLREWCILEGSGGITKTSLSEWSASRVDLISTSAMNRGVKPLDISLIIEGEI